MPDPHPIYHHMVVISHADYWTTIIWCLFCGFLFGVMIFPQLKDWCVYGFESKQNRTIIKLLKEKEKKEKQIRKSKEFKKRWTMAQQAIKIAFEEGDKATKIFHIYECPIDAEIRRQLTREKFETTICCHNTLKIYWNITTKKDKTDEDQ